MARTLLFGSLLTGGLFSTTAMAENATDQENGPVVQTAAGPVLGIVRSGIHELLGIPYAAPPIGPLRWMPPQPVKHWFNGCEQMVDVMHEFFLVILHSCPIFTFVHECRAGNRRR
jgi:Carboxylesterase family